MEDQQANIEPSQQFENIDFNSSPDHENNKESSNNDDQEQVPIQKTTLKNDGSCSVIRTHCKSKAFGLILHFQCRIFFFIVEI